MAGSHGDTCACCSPVPPDPSGRPAEDRADEAVCYCPIDGIIDAISKKYAMQIVGVVAATQPTRFKHLEEWFPSASTSTLSARLEELVEHGLLSRLSYDEVPPHVEYRLTSAGEELEERLEPLLEWAARAGPGRDRHRVQERGE